MVLPSDWLLSTYGVVTCIYEWLCGFLSFQSVFVSFHCYHYHLTSFYFITSFFVSYYLTMGIANMMLYSINSDAAVVRRPYPANYCYIYNSHIFFSFSLFVYVIPPFLLRILLFLRLYYFFFFSTKWRWVSRCFCGQLLSCLLSLIIEYIFILPSWSCRNLMVDLLMNSLFWIAS